jgi:hypothetical protein
MKMPLLSLAFLALPFTSLLANTIIIDPAVEAGEIKMMNGINNGPVVPRGETVGNFDRGRSNFPYYKMLEIPLVRTHDANFFNEYGGPHTVDITAIFPDFSKDPADPKSYDFTCTDKYLSEIRSTGAKIVYRLGQTIEYPVKKYGVNPPSDDLKWAKIAEGIIRHYNEGWANGFKWDIKDWEIWNEPDNDGEKGTCWTGDRARFFDFYETVSKHLKKRFSSLNIGGPAVGWNEKWAEDFVVEMAKRKVPIDFFSYHAYANTPEKIVERAQRMRKLLDDNGYKGVPTYLDEWNYIRDWWKGLVYSLRAMQGMKGAAFTAAAMCAAQTAPIDVLMYYDARPSEWNGVFDRNSYRPIKGYWCFLAWAKLRQFGKAAQVKVIGKNLYAVVAKGEEGKLRALVVSYFDDDNNCHAREITVKLSQGQFLSSRINTTDNDFSFSETPSFIENGALRFSMEPNSFVYIEATAR